MDDGRTTEVTRFLTDPELNATEREVRLLPLVYEQLRAIARERMAGERVEHTLQATALVHEAYLRLVGERQLPWQNRAHFFAAAAEAMRRILLDHAKAHGRDKRRGNRHRLPLSVADLAMESDPSEILSLNEAICRLEERDPDITAVVRLRFFAGLGVEETAKSLGVSPATVKRRWELARTWLYREITRGTEDDIHVREATKPEARRGDS